MKNNENFCVYKHTSPSGKCYIGITSKNVEERWGTNGNKYTVLNKNKKYKHPFFANAILKYGWDNIQHEILHTNLSFYSACELEKYYIEFYKKLQLSYNITDGGEGSSGHRMSEEAKQKLSQSHFGKKQSSEAVLKRVLKNTGKRRTPEQKAKTSKKINQYNLNGDFVNTFFGIREASRITGINSSHIGDCCNKKRKSAGGYLWSFIYDTSPRYYKKNVYRKKVKCQFSNGQCKIWDSIKEASEESNISRYFITKYCNFEILDKHGNKWSFIYKCTS